MHTNIDVVDGSQLLKLASLGLGGSLLILAAILNMYIPLQFVQTTGIPALDFALIGIGALVLYAILFLHAFGVSTTNKGITFKRLVGSKTVSWADVAKFERGNFGQSYKLVFEGGFIYFSTGFRKAHAILEDIKSRNSGIASTEW